MSSQDAIVERGNRSATNAGRECAGAVGGAAKRTLREAVCALQ